MYICDTYLYITDIKDRICMSEIDILIRNNQQKNIKETKIEFR